MHGLDDLMVLDVTGERQTAQVWDRILVALPRLKKLSISDLSIFPAEDMRLHRRIADGLWATSQLSDLRPGSLQTDLPDGRVYNLDVIADSIVAWGRWDILCLDIVPGGVWRNRRPRAKKMELLLRRDCVNGDINWDWFCSDASAESKLCISGNFGENVFPGDDQPFSSVSFPQIFVQLRYPFICDRGLRRFVKKVGGDLCIQFFLADFCPNSITRITRGIRTLQSDDISSFGIVFFSSVSSLLLGNDKLFEMNRAIVAVMRRIVHENDRMGSLRLTVTVSTDAIGPLIHALLECETADLTWGEWFRKKTVVVTDE
jgi:hypothetical protein